MVKVIVVKLPNGAPEDDKYIKLGQVYEAFELRDEKCGDDFYKHFYALNLGWGIFNIAPEDVEVVEDVSFIQSNPLDDNLEQLLKKANTQGIITVPKQKILLVADGLVDTDHLNALGINYIMYRDTSPKPELIEY